MNSLADSIRLRNARLDAELRLVRASIPDSAVHAKPDPTAWTIAELLGHLAEFPIFFANELRRWRQDEQAVIGRTHDHDQRQAAVAAGANTDLDALGPACDRAMNRLADELAWVRDEDLAAPTNNVKYGVEPMAEFLERYVLRHKQEHLDQLRAAISAAERHA